LKGGNFIQTFREILEEIWFDYVGVGTGLSDWVDLALDKLSFFVMAAVITAPILIFLMIFWFIWRKGNRYD